MVPSFGGLPMAQQAFDAFWGELSPCSHVVEIYEDDAAFTEHLTEFVSGGLVQDEAVVIIATPIHRLSLVNRLVARGFDVSAAIDEGRLILSDAQETVAKFFLHDWPDEYLFQKVIGEVLQQATRNGRKVRAFGEMVALLWAKGLCGATIRLEHLWTDFCRKQAFSLYCAYPKSGFTDSPAVDIERVRDSHSAVFAA
jgi:hypothetical protein